MRKRRHAGFTLIELMVALAVFAILVTVAVPSFRNIMASNQLATTANDIVAALRLARMQAVEHKTEVQFCSNSAAANGNSVLGNACATQTAAVYSRSNSGNAVQSRRSVDPVDHELQLASDVTALRFSPSGVAHQVGASTPYTGIVADICTERLTADNHSVIKLVGGHVVHTVTSSGACP